MELVQDEASRTIVDGRTWIKMTADLDQGPVGWAYLFASDNDIASTLYVLPSGMHDVRKAQILDCGDNRIPECFRKATRAPENLKWGEAQRSEWLMHTLDVLIERCSRCVVASNWLRCSISMARLGMPVNASCKARCRINSSFSQRSVMSLKTAM